MARAGLTIAQIKKAGIQSETPSSPPMQKQLDVHTRQIDSMLQIMLLGFVVIIIMVGTIIITVFLDYKNSVDQLHRDQYDFLNKRIENLESISTETAKLK